MNGAIGIKILAVGLALSLGGTLASCAQGGYGGYNYPQQQPTYPNQQPAYPNQQPDYTNPQYGNNQPGDEQQPYDRQGYGQPDFYANLAPHGQWVNTPQYGRVWIPNAGPNFQPYATNGHWVVTEYGNTWVSDYAWGWAPFHYGRWFQDPYRGWAWVPGNDWGPAWVSWRSGGGYYGWAPLGPGINMNGNIPWNQYVFVPQTYITSPRLYSYCVPHQQVINVYQNTTIINNIYRSGNQEYAYGPRRDEIERVTRQNVPVYRIENSSRPGRDVVQGNSVGIYRPESTSGPRSDGSSRTYNAPFDNSGRGNASGNSRYGGTPPTPDQPESRRMGNGSYDAGNTGSYGGRGSGSTYGGRGAYGGRGNYGTTPPATPTTATETPTPSAPAHPQSPWSSRGGQGRPNYEVQQNQPLPQQPQTYPQQPARQQEQAPREWSGSSRGAGSYGQPATSQPQSQPGSGAGGGRQVEAQVQTQPQSQPQAQQPPQSGAGTYQSGSGSSRGPR